MSTHLMMKLINQYERKMKMEKKKIKKIRVDLLMAVVLIGIVVAGALFVPKIKGMINDNGERQHKESKEETEWVYTAKSMSDGVTKSLVAQDGNAVDDAKKAVADCSLDMFKVLIRNEDDKNNSGKNSNIVFSPLSAMMAMALVANGAQNETLKQIEDAFGIEIGKMNDFACNYMKSNEQMNPLEIGNSLWFNNSIADSVSQKFIQTNKDYYNTDIFNEPFDESTRLDINNWVAKKTHGLFDEILKEGDINKSLYLFAINTVFFESEWMDKFDKDDVEEYRFYNEDYTESRIDFLCGTDYDYIEDDNACGFSKEYKDGRFAFVALLPDENVSVKEYIESLDGEKIKSLVDGRKYIETDIRIPKFKFEDEYVLDDVFKEMGIKDILDQEKADISEFKNGFMNNIVQDVYINVEEERTTAAAVTSARVVTCDLSEDKPEKKKVYLDRPFVYMIYDNEYDIPVFIGTVRNM